MRLPVFALFHPLFHRLADPMDCTECSIYRLSSDSDAWYLTPYCVNGAFIRVSTQPYGALPRQKY